MDEIGVMRGFLQCIIIDIHGGNYNNTSKAIAMEEPPQDLSNEDMPPATSYERDDIKEIKSFVKKDINKELAFNLCDTQNAQRSKQYYLECIEVLFKESTRSGGTYVHIYNLVYLYVYVCMYICMCVYVCVYVCVCMYVCMYVCMFHMYVYS